MASFGTHPSHFKENGAAMVFCVKSTKSIFVPGKKVIEKKEMRGRTYFSVSSIMGGARSGGIVLNVG